MINIEQLNLPIHGEVEYSNHVTPRKVEFLKHYIMWLVENVFDRPGRLRFNGYNRDFHGTKKDYRWRSSYGFKHDLEKYNRNEDFMKEFVFKDFPDFEGFYSTNSDFKKAMHECGVRVKNKKSLSWGFK